MKTLQKKFKNLKNIVIKIRQQQYLQRITRLNNNFLAKKEKISKNTYKKFAKINKKIEKYEKKPK
jgi:hypothetical protein